MTQANHETASALSNEGEAPPPGVVAEAEFDEAPEGAEAAADEEESLESPGYQPPAGFEKVSEDIQAYWDPKSSGPMEWVPRTIRLMDSNQQDSKQKSTALVIGELKKECMLLDNAREVNEEGERQKAKLKKFPAGTSVGVWAKAGMRDLRRSGGAHVWMAPAGKRKVAGRPQPMALFDIRRMKGEKGGPLELLEDLREESIVEPGQVEFPPWWLHVLPDGGLEAAQEAIEEKGRALKEKIASRKNRAAAS